MLAAEERFDDESEIAVGIYWDCCDRTCSNQLWYLRWRRFGAWPIQRCYQIPARHGFEQQPEVSAEARMLFDGHSGHIW